MLFRSISAACTGLRNRVFGGICHRARAALSGSEFHAVAWLSRARERLRFRAMDSAGDGVRLATGLSSACRDFDRARRFTVISRNGSDAGAHNGNFAEAEIHFTAEALPCSFKTNPTGEIVVS